PKFKPQASMTLRRAAGYLGPCVLFGSPDVTISLEVAGVLSGTRSIREALGAAFERIPAKEVIRIPVILASEIDGSGRVPRAGSDTSSAQERANWPRVSIIIPTHDRSDLLEQCLRSVLARTDYPREAIEIMVIDHGSVEPATIDLLRRSTEDGTIKVL